MSDLSIVEVTSEIRDLARRIVGEFRQSGWPAKEEEIANLIARHRASEAERVREACAKVCDRVEQQQDDDHGAANTGGAMACAAAIRSLPIGGR
jgi:hypothetical protein